MLYTDADTFITPADLQVIDPEITTSLGLINQCNPNAPAPLSVQNVIANACKLVGNEITARMMTYGNNVNIAAPGMALHNTAVMFNLSREFRIPYLRLNQIVVSARYAGQTTPLHDYIARVAIRSVYDSIAFRMAVDKNAYDRYSARRDWYTAKINTEFWPILKSTGIDYVLRPLDCPGSAHMPDTGVWGTGNVGTTTSGGAAGGVFDIAITYVDQSQTSYYQGPTNRGNSESHPSATVVGMNVNAGSALTVSIASLNPPDGHIPSSLQFANYSYYARRATGWNVYVGLTGQALYLQNPLAPIPITQKSLVFAGDPVLSGYPVGYGQHGDGFLPIRNIAFRM